MKALLSQVAFLTLSVQYLESLNLLISAANPSVPLRWSALQMTAFGLNHLQVFEEVKQKLAMKQEAAVELEFARRSYCLD